MGKKWGPGRPSKRAFFVLTRRNAGLSTNFYQAWVSMIDIDVTQNGDLWEATATSSRKIDIPGTPPR